MLRYLPLVLAVAAIVTAASWDFSVNSDSAGASKAWATLIENKVPSQLGDWTGVDTPVDEEVKLTAGAVGYISRQYTHSETGKVVNLWLIVGHMQGVVRHTPDVCYKSSGYKQQERKLAYPIEIEGQPPSKFWTTWFLGDAPQISSSRRRVFWAWTLPQEGEPIAWQASSAPRYDFAGARSLFKMYFTTDEVDDQLLDESVALQFAELMIPAMSELLEQGIKDFTAGKDLSTAETAEKDESGESSDDPA